MVSQYMFFFYYYSPASNYIIIDGTNDNEQRRAYPASSTIQQSLYNIIQPSSELITQD